MRCFSNDWFNYSCEFSFSAATYNAIEQQQAQHSSLFCVGYINIIYIKYNYSLLIIINILLTGYYVHLSTLAEVREQVLQYVPVMARPLVLQKTDHPVIWTPVYADITVSWKSSNFLR